MGCLVSASASGRVSARRTVGAPVDSVPAAFFSVPAAFFAARIRATVTVTQPWLMSGISISGPAAACGVSTPTLSRRWLAVIISRSAARRDPCRRGTPSAPRSPVGDPPDVDERPCGGTAGGANRSEQRHGGCAVRAHSCHKTIIDDWAGELVCLTRSDPSGRHASFLRGALVATGLARCGIRLDQ